VLDPRETSEPAIGRGGDPTQILELCHSRPCLARRGDETARGNVGHRLSMTESEMATESLKSMLGR